MMTTTRCLAVALLTQSSALVAVLSSLVSASSSAFASSYLKTDGSTAQILCERTFVFCVVGQPHPYAGPDLGPSADLPGVNLYLADLPDADLANANLTGANLRIANLTDASLTGANLAAANLIDTKLINADLGGATLIDALMFDARLNGADLTGAFHRFPITRSAPK